MAKEIEMSLDEAIKLTEKALDRLRYSKDADAIDEKEISKWRNINHTLRLIKDQAEIRPII